MFRLPFFLNFHSLLFCLRFVPCKNCERWRWIGNGQLIMHTYHSIKKTLTKWLCANMCVCSFDSWTLCRQTLECKNANDESKWTLYFDFIRTNSKFVNLTYKYTDERQTEHLPLIEWHVMLFLLLLSIVFWNILIHYNAQSTPFMHIKFIESFTKNEGLWNSNTHTEACRHIHIHIYRSFGL